MVVPLLVIVVEHVFGVYDGNVEVLQSSADGGGSDLDVVGLNTFEMVQKFVELMCCRALVSGRDSELLKLVVSCSDSWGWLVGGANDANFCRDLTSLHFPQTRRFQRLPWKQLTRRRVWERALLRTGQMQLSVVVVEDPARVKVWEEILGSRGLKFNIR